MEDPERLQQCRQVFEEANKSLRNCELKEERLLLLESWRDFEREFGTDTTIERIRKLLPEKVKKRRKLTAEDGVRVMTSVSAAAFIIILDPKHAASQLNARMKGNSSRRVTCEVQV